MVISFRLFKIDHLISRRFMQWSGHLLGFEYGSFLVWESHQAFCVVNPTLPLTLEHRQQIGKAIVLSTTNSIITLRSSILISAVITLAEPTRQPLVQSTMIPTDGTPALDTSPRILYYWLRRTGLSTISKYIRIRLIWELLHRSFRVSLL